MILFFVLSKKFMQFCFVIVLLSDVYFILDNVESFFVLGIKFLNDSPSFFAVILFGKINVIEFLYDSWCPEIFGCIML